MSNFTEEREKKHREKFGRFYYSETVGMDWEKPEKQNVTGGIPNGHDGFCIGSDDIEAFHSESLRLQAERFLGIVEGKVLLNGHMEHTRDLCTDTCGKPCGRNEVLEEVANEIRKEINQ